jgi:adenylosuccinate lyase
VIARYTRPELGALWTDEARMEAWRRVEVAACEEMEGPTEAELEAIRAATFTVEAVQERERVTDHDVAAFVDVLGASAGDAGRWIHFGVSSSDVLDTATALQLRAAGEIVLTGARELVSSLTESAREHVDTVCVGRTHGVHAEPTTFGVKLAGFAMEAGRNAERLERAFAAVSVGAISGAVGTYSVTSPQFEERVLARLGLQREPVSTQVVARDRHAELLQAIALAGAGLERLATEIRHLQRTEVREVEEPFRGGAQKGSSAMPHKRNPITTERITGLARVLRGNATAAVENVALWHERDISHSGAERVILPDSTILLDYLQHLAIRVVRGWSSTPTGCARTSTSRTARCSPSACCSRSSRAGWRATTLTGSCRRRRSGRGTSASRCATCSSANPSSGSTSTRSSTSASTRATPPRSSAGCPPPEASRERRALSARGLVPPALDPPRPLLACGP